jgi:hypothetical protein
MIELDYYLIDWHYSTESKENIISCLRWQSFQCLLQVSTYRSKENLKLR